MILTEYFLEFYVYNVYIVKTTNSIVHRYGKTYGNDTRDAKRWLRGDFSS